MLTQEQVQNTLVSIGYYKEFTVIFTKTNGERRKITGFLEKPEGKLRNTQAVPVKVTQGDAAGQWRSFRLDSVLSIT
jgi:hypothetical protein